MKLFVILYIYVALESLQELDMFYLQAEGEARQQEVQRLQVRELLAKQTKQRQDRKKLEEQERLLREQGVPLRHWPEEQVPQQIGKYFYVVARHEFKCS